MANNNQRPFIRDYIRDAWLNAYGFQSGNPSAGWFSIPADPQAFMENRGVSSGVVKATPPGRKLKKKKARFLRQPYVVTTPVLFGGLSEEPIPAKVNQGLSLPALIKRR